MDFLDRFEPADRTALLALGTVSSVPGGTALVRRGQRGGDLFLVEEGVLEAVDSRVHPEIVLEGVPAGQVVGELAFLDLSPRAADLRASGPCRVRTWHRATLCRELEQNPGLGLAFYRALAQICGERVRQITSSALVGALSGRRDAEEAGPERDRWIRAATRAWARYGQQAGGPDEQEAAGRLGAGLLKVSNRLARFSDLGQASRVGQALASAIHGVTERSALGLALRERPPGTPTTPELWRRMVFQQPEGADAEGLMLDRVLLALPTPQAVAWTAARTTAFGRLAVGGQAAPRVSILGPSAATLAVALAVPPGGRLTLIDPRPEVLRAAGLALAGPGMPAFDLYQADPVLLALGRSKLHLPPQDLLVMEGLLDQLPDRLVVGMAAWCGKVLIPRGHGVFSALQPTEDTGLFDHVFDWPTLRRTAPRLRDLLQHGGLECPTCLQSPEHSAVLLVHGPPLPGSAVGDCP